MTPPLHRRVFALGAVTLGVAGWTAWRRPVDAPDAQPPGHWPELEVFDLDDHPLLLPARADRVRLINVWARWCPPCRRELPSLQRLAALLRRQRAQVLAIALDDDAFALREYVAAQGLVLQVLRYPSHGRGVPGAAMLPRTFAVAPDARVLAQWVGAREWDATGQLAGLLAILGRDGGGSP